jgi:hypothetical protein
VVVEAFRYLVVVWDAVAPAQGMICIQKEVTMQLVGQENVAARKVRHFGVYKNSKLIFKMESKPGVLQSVGTPPPQGWPKHAWLNALSFRSSGESDWVALLRQAKNFDGFLKLLVANGFDLFSIDKSAAPLTISEGHRIVDGSTVVAVTWDHPGQFSTLQEQPEVGALTNPSAAMVVYDTTKASPFAQIYLRAKHYEAIQEALKSMRLKATSV